MKEITLEFNSQGYSTNSQDCAINLNLLYAWRAGVCEVLNQLYPEYEIHYNEKDFNKIFKVTLKRRHGV